jgi:GMP reductase
MPMFSCVQQIIQRDTAIGFPGGKCRIRNKPVIADGSIKYYGDIAKALVAGATMVMSGKLFASCIDSPAEIIDGKKQYRGSTSFAAKKINKHIEGKIVELDANTTIETRLEEIKQALQSSISYAGGSNLEVFKKVKWIRV